MSLDQNSIAKHIFLCQAYSHVPQICNIKTSITYDLLNSVRKYGLSTYLHNYLFGGQLLDKHAWKQMSKESVYLSENTKWKDKLYIKGALRFSNVQTELKPNFIYHIINKNMSIRKYYLI